LILALISFSVSHEVDTLKFLGEIEPMVTGTDDIAPDQILAFAKGFAAGLHAFNGVTICGLDDVNVQNDIKGIYNIIKDTHVSNLKDQIMKFIPIVKDLKDRLMAIAPQCKDSYNTVKSMIQRMTDYVTSIFYTTKLVAHTVAHSITIVGKITDIQSNFKSRPADQNGQAVGDLVHYTLFWDI